MRIAFLVPDNREICRQYDLSDPYFGTAPSALLEGFAMLAANPLTTEFRNVEIHVVCCTQKKMSAPQKLAGNIFFHQLHVPKYGWLRAGYLGCALAVRRKLREIKPNLVHAQGTERDCAVSAILSGYPKLLTLHGNLRLIRKSIGFKPLSAMWLQSFIEGFVVPRFDGVVCITNYTKRAVEHETPKTWVVPNAVDSRFLKLGVEREFPKLELKSAESSKAVVLVVASVDFRKNQNAFIRAIDALAEEYPLEARFFGKCGEDRYSHEFRSLVATRPWCYYGGMISRENLKNELSQASMLVLPTHEDNCPMVVLEAQAVGVPVIASNVGGIPDLIHHELNGLLIDPDLPESISASVKSILVDKELAGRLSEQGILSANNTYHPAVVAERHYAIYKEMLQY